MKTIAIIPAKGTSQRLPSKNLRLMLGKPLVVWAIETAKQSKRINRVIVSTDDNAIREVAIRAGAEVPYLEPASIAAGGGNMEALMTHALGWLKEHERYTPDALLLLLPTNPLRLPEHLDAMVEQFEKGGADCVAAVCEASATHNPYWMFMRELDGSVVTTMGGALKDMPLHSQDLPRCYIRNDICFVLKPGNLLGDPGVLWGDKTDLYEMDEIFDTDINTEEDWRVTENKLSRLLSTKKTTI